MDFSISHLQKSEAHGFQYIKSMQKEKDQMYALSQELLSSRAPSPSYPVFLYEQMTLFKLKALQEGRPYQLLIPSQFLETFLSSSFLSST